MSCVCPINLLLIKAIHSKPKPVFSGDKDGALAIYKKAVENFPENSELLSVLGLLYLQMGDTQRAFEHLGETTF